MTQFDLPCFYTRMLTGVMVILFSFPSFAAHPCVEQSGLEVINRWIDVRDEKGQNYLVQIARKNTLKVLSCAIHQQPNRELFRYQHEVLSQVSIEFDPSMSRGEGLVQTVGRISVGSLSGTPTIYQISLLLHEAYHILQLSGLGTRWALSGTDFKDQRALTEIKVALKNGLKIGDECAADLFGNRVLNELWFSSENFSLHYYRNFPNACRAFQDHYRHLPEVLTRPKEPPSTEKRDRSWWDWLSGR